MTAHQKNVELNLLHKNELKIVDINQVTKLKNSLLSCTPSRKL